MVSGHPVLSIPMTRSPAGHAIAAWSSHGNRYEHSYIRRKQMKTTWIALLAGGVLMHSSAFADVSYQETTQYTGGSMMGMLKMAGAFSSQAKQATSPVTSTVMIHGGRMLRSNPH